MSQARRNAEKGRYHLTRAMLDATREGEPGAEALPGCLALLIPPEDFPPPGTAVDAAIALRSEARWLAKRFPGRAWIAHTPRLDGRDPARLHWIRRIAQAAGIRPVAAGGALMHDAARRPLADVMTALRLHCSVAEAGLALAPNAELRLHERATLAHRHPPELLAETLAVAARCRFDLDALRYEYPAELVPAGETPTSWLRRLVEGGLAWRYGEAASDRRAAAPAAIAAAAAPPAEDPAPPTVRAQIEHELALVAELGYEPYFLTVHDIVRFARDRGILCQGRGSAANSVVCWALGITEVDPQLGIMLVERFISRERDEPPDIDVDFEHERREEVIQYLYRKYGRERAALAATVIRYRSRSALRDVGRALGLDEAQIERLTREHHWFDGRRILPERLAEAGLDPASPVTQRLVALTEELIGFPRHLSQHVGGFVIARGRLDELVPVENAAMPERTVIQWDKDDLDAVGLMKIDVLALGMLSALRRGLALVSAWRGRALTLATIPRERPEVYAMLSRADSVGVFQVESRAQMTMLPRLKPRRFYDLVVEVAIVRPGPIQGGMVHPYLQARERVARGEDPLVDLNEEIRGVLARTLGVPIFQEQVMQLAVVAAGFTGGEADQLRRAMGAWRRKGELERYRQKLLAGLDHKGYDADFAQRLCQQIEGFGSYGFPESHAASFALLVYASAWLKCFEPAAFLAALLNSQPMGFYAPSQLIQDARRHGVEVRAADVGASAWDCTLEPTPPAGGTTTECGQAAASDGGARDPAARGPPRPADDPQPRPRRRHPHRRRARRTRLRRHPGPRRARPARRRRAAHAGRRRRARQPRRPSPPGPVAGERRRAPARPARRGPRWRRRRHARGTRRDRGPARRLCPPRLHPRPPPARLRARPARGAALSHRHRHRRRPRPHARPRRRPGHLPPAPRHRQGHALRHPGRRDRAHQRDRPPRALRAAAPHPARRAPDGRVRPDPPPGPRRAPGGEPGGGPLAPARQSGRAQPGLPLKTRHAMHPHDGFRTWGEASRSQGGE